MGTLPCHGGAILLHGRHVSHPNLRRMSYGMKYAIPQRMASTLKSTTDTAWRSNPPPPSSSLRRLALLQGGAASEGPWPNAADENTDYPDENLGGVDPELCFRDLGRMIERGGPLPPDRAVAILRRAARALSKQEANGLHGDGGGLVFWLGAVLFFALTGKAPLAAPVGGRPPAEPPAPSSLAPHMVPASVDAVVRTCMALRRASRYNSVTDLYTALLALPYVEEVDDRTSLEPPTSERLSDPPPSGVSRRESIENGPPRRPTHRPSGFHARVSSVGRVGRSARLAPR